MVLDLTIAIGDYDRIGPLRTGEVAPEGVSLQFVDGGETPGDIFAAVVEGSPFQVSEMSLSTYALWTSTGECPFVGIPVFPSRFFRHASIYVHADAGIDAPADLGGKRVGVPEYQMTAATMTRGMLEHEYGVDPADVTWLTAREEKLPIEAANRTRIDRFAADDFELVDRFEAGEFDALISTLIPDLEGDRVSRLFPDFKSVERDYHERTGIFPIMHTVVLDEAVYEENPWVATALYESMERAKDLALDRLYTNRALPVSVPWLLDAVEEARDAFGEDFWPYGVERNRRSIEALTQYSFEQGLATRELSPADLFVEELLET